MKLRPLSSVYGKIRQVLLVMPKNLREEKASEMLEQYFGGIFRALSDRVEFLVVCANDDKAVVEKLMKKSNLIAENHVVINADQYLRVTDSGIVIELEPGKWAQDPFSVLVTGNGYPVLLEPFFFSGRLRLGYSKDQDGNIKPNTEENSKPRLTDGNHFLAEIVSTQTGYLIKPTRYFLEGGNLLFGDDYLLIGKNLFIRNWKTFFPEIEDENTALKAFEKILKSLFGVRYAIVIGLNEEIKLDSVSLETGHECMQPLFHIDLFITLAGRDHEGREIVLIARIDNRDVYGEPGYETQIRKLANAFDEIEKNLRTYDASQPGPRFEIRRIPIEIIVEKGLFRFRSYNNALIEVYDGVKIAYLPDYYPDRENESPEDSSDSRAASVFKEFNFHIKKVKGNFAELSENFGSLHCLSKVLKRS